MPKSDNQKLKIFYIRDYLLKYSHENRIIPVAELQKMLEARDISCDRKTVYSDIRALQDYGEDIISVPGRNGGFYYASRQFELPELKLLISAVQSSRYLTQKKSDDLIRKLCQLCNADDARLMRRDVYISGRVKSMNETIYYSVDAIQEAISRNLQITFRYFDWNPDGTRNYRKNSYAASPYGLCQDNENCYLLAYSQRHGVTSYRVDRMSDIVCTDQPRIPCEALTGAALQKYANTMFQMFAGDTVSVRLRFHRSIINAVVDRFGHGILLHPDGEDHVACTVQVAVSPMFLSWVIGFGEKAQILYPDRVVQQCRQLCEAAMSQYSPDQ